MKNKILSLFLVSALAVSMLAGCGTTKEEKPSTETTENKTEPETESKDEGSDEGTTSSGNTVTLKTVSMFGGTDPNAVVYESINKELQDEFDYITIEDASQTADQDWKATVAADFAVGEEPDVIQFYTDANADSIVSTDKFVTLEEIKAEYPDYAKDTTEMALDAVTNTDGVRRAVPTTGYWEGLFCNKDLFDEYKVEIPTDWESLVKAIEVFNKNDITPIAISLNHVPHYWVEFLMLYSAGKEEFEKVPESAPAEWVKGLETFKTLRDLDAFPSDTDVVDNDFANQLFEDKKAAMKLDGSWYSGAEGVDKETTIVTAFPGVENQKAEPKTIISGLSSGFYITKKAWDDPDKREAAVKFVMAHTSKEGVTKYWEETGKVLVTAVEMDKAEGLTPLGDSIVEYVKSATATALPTDARLGADPYTIIINNISKISVGSADAKEVLDEALKEYAEIKSASE